MKTNLIFTTLGVSATLLLGNSPAVSLATNTTPVNQTVEKVEATTTEVKPEVVPEVKEEPQPTPEVVVTVEKGDTLQKIATENNTTYVRLFNANPAIANPDTLHVGDQITIPAEDKELEDRFAQVAAAPVASKPSTARAHVAKSTGSRSYNTGNGWWCTDYVHSKRPDVPIYGNAGYSWISAAKADGKATGSTPQAGAIAVMPGHVAYVESVNADGTYTVSEMGWNYKAGNYNIRTVSPGAFGAFIY